MKKEINELFHAAIRDGDEDEFFKMLQKNRLSRSHLDQLLVNVCKMGNAESASKFAKNLLTRGARPNAVALNGSLVVHIAAELGLSDLLQVLLRHGAHPEELDTKGRTALHCAMFSVHREKNAAQESDALDCVKSIIEHSSKLNLNIVNKVDESMQTAVHYAAKYGLCDIVKYLVSKNANIDINIDGTTARDLIKLMPTEIQLENIKIEIVNEDLPTKLFYLLARRKEGEFSTKIDNVTDLDINANNGRHTLLQAAVYHGCNEAACKLINKNCNVNLTTRGEKRSALILAVIGGHEKILEALLKVENIDLNARENVLNGTALHVAVHENRFTCAELLLDNDALDVNAQDKRECTAIHYAARSCKREFLNLLLKNNANIFVLNDKQEPAFKYISADLIRRHLDDSIHPVTMAKEQACLEFDFSVLIPLKPRGSVCDNVKSNSYEMVPADNNAICSVASTKLPTSSALENLALLAKFKSHRHLLDHPLIKSWLHLESHRFASAIRINFVLYLIYFISIYVHMGLLFFKSSVAQNSTENNETISHSLYKYEETQFFRYFLQTIICLSVVYIICREILQAFITGCMYLRQFENWLEIALVVASCGLLLEPTEDALLRSIAATAVLVAGSEMALLLGRYRGLATFTTMFRSVSLSFMKLFLAFSILITAFAFSFFIIFYEACDKNDKDCKVQSQIPTIFYKVLIMWLTEIEKEGLNFQNAPIISHILLFLFVFFAVIVLLNLLTSLAVNDTNEIKNKAEVLICVSEIRSYFNIERIFLQVKKILRLRQFQFLHNFTIRLLPEQPGNHLITNVHDGQKVHGIGMSSHYCNSSHWHMIVRDSLVLQHLRTHQANSTYSTIQSRLEKIENDINQILHKLS